MKIHIGTSGWHYKHWLGDFYPERYPTDKMFTWYAREFQTVEINNSFYRLPQEKIFQRRRELAPPGFLFAVKASRFITHIKRLKDASDSVDLLFSRAAPLGSNVRAYLVSAAAKVEGRCGALERVPGCAAEEAQVLD
jgi:uncharacterized protein YecE (DUF72 family)